MSKILLGPVVGRVTCTSAIILLEVDTEVILECRVYESNAKGQEYHSSTVSFPVRSARVFTFNELRAGVLYKFIIPELNKGQTLGSFKTFQENLTDLRLAVVSCDRKKDSTGDMWPSLDGEVLQCDMCLHIGDNIYMDDDVKGEVTDEEMFNPKLEDQNMPYVKARKLLRDKEQSEWPEYKEKITELFKEQYRSTWSRHPKAHVLANTSNLMILDDHEIRDDFGDREEDSDENGKGFFLNAIAMSLYHEYQRQLWDRDILKNGSKSLYNEFYAIEQGPLLITMLEPRTSKAIYKSKRDEGDDSYYGKQQWASFKNVVEKAEKSKARILLVNTTMPLFFLKSRITRFIGNKIADDLKGYINYNMVDPCDRPTQELVDFMDVIKKWKSVSNHKSPSTALIMSGEVHMGGFTDIYSEKNKKLICRQISTGAISLKNFNKAQYAVARSALHFTDTYQDYSYNHYDWTKNSNYVIVHFKLSEDSLQYDVTLKHVEGKVKKSSLINATSKEEFWAKGKPGESCTCDIL